MRSSKILLLVLVLLICTMNIGTIFAYSSDVDYRRSLKNAKDSINEKNHIPKENTPEINI